MSTKFQIVWKETGEPFNSLQDPSEDKDALLRKMASIEENSAAAMGKLEVREICPTA